MPLPKPKLPAGWRRAKLIALINELYLSFRGCGTCGVVVNALALSTNPQAGPLRYSLAFHLRRSKKPNSEPKLRPPAVSKSLTRSRTGSLSPCGSRLCHRFTREISSLRCSTRSPPCGLRLGTQVDIYRCRCRWRRHLRCCLCLWLTTEPESLCQRRTALRISRGDEGMIAPQSPSLQ